MEKPEIKPTLQQISPALPDPYQFSEKIFESIIFMDENPEATATDLQIEMLELWAAEQEQLDIIKGDPTRLNEIYVKPSIVSSLIIFTYIYLTYYRYEDFADLEIFLDIYYKYQLFLNYAKRDREFSFRLFDLGNIDDALDGIM